MVARRSTTARHLHLGEQLCAEYIPHMECHRIFTMSSFTYNDPGLATATATAPLPAAPSEFSPEELLTLTQLHAAPGRNHWRAYLPAFAVLLCMIYVVPTAIELLLIRYVNPYACALLGDVAGCCFLLLAGLRRTAVSLYTLFAIVELALIYSPAVPDEAVILFSNLLPTIFASWLMTRRPV